MPKWNIALHVEVKIEAETLDKARECAIDSILALPNKRDENLIQTVLLRKLDRKIGD